MEDKVILVNKEDKEIGTEYKFEAHKKGLLHRAFSIFIFDSEGNLLLQKRAKKKYHSAGLWTNTCCSHPRPKEIILVAAHRRLKEEMGFDCELTEIFSFVYKTKLRGLFEHEFDHVLIGRFDGKIKFNKKEVEEIKWIKPKELKNDIKNNSNNYSYWIKKSLNKVLKYANTK